uniref:Uncharacterized protein n=1 Tax=Solibacter usitatus (strain Ellin6076) TaxID=234267 RepID=Q01R32_SOLUE
MSWAWVLLAAGISAVAADKPPSSLAIEENSLKQLLEIHRVYVDRLTGGETAAQMRDILLSSLESSKLFILTENQERADAILKGAAEDMVFTEVHSSSDSVNARANLGNGRSTKTSGSYSAGVGFGESESDHSAERRHEAIAAVRLVNKDGDVIWATTQESLGAKFRGASTDVADKITAKLKEDFERARRLITSSMQVVPLGGPATEQLGQVALKQEPRRD